MYKDWPSVDDYAQLFEARQVGFATATPREVRNAGGYDRFVRDTASVPCRGRNWHDFFNALVWARFPNLKQRLLQLQLREGKVRETQERTPLQHLLTQFDECGLVILSADPSVLGQIASLGWKSVFFERRDRFLESTRVVCFGHAVMAAMLTPYIGLMSKALLVACESEALTTASADVDRWLPSLLEKSLAGLAPVPVLGIPEWFEQGRVEAFYDDSSYFRTRRRTPVSHGPRIISAAAIE